MAYKCSGCGAILQDKDELKPGYIAKIDNEKDKPLFCKRCFRIRNYNEISKNELPYDVYLNIISKITYSNSLFIYVIDALELINSINLEVLEKLRKKDVIFLINKKDILPKSIKDGRIKNYIKSFLKKYDYKYKDIIVTSSKRNYNIDLLTEKLVKWSKGRNIYFIGLSNVGKSTLLNTLIRSIGLLDYDLITTSKILGTTLSLVEIPFFKGKGKVYDTPGLVLKESLLAKLDYRDYDNFLANKEIKPLIYQMEKDNSLIIGGVLMVSFLDDANVVLYMAKGVKVLRCKTEKGNLHFPNRVNELFDLNTEFEEVDTNLFKMDKLEDLAIMGLGFISFKDETRIEVKVLSGVKVIKTDGLFNS